MSRRSIISAVDQDTAPPTPSASAELAKRTKWLMGGLGFLVVMAGAVGATWYFTSTKSRPAGAAFTDVSENLVNSNTYVVNSSQMTGGSPTRPLPDDAVLTPSWQAAEEARAAAQAGTSGPSMAPTSMVPAPVESVKAPAEPKKDDTRDWLQANPGTAAICYPKNGYEVVMMVNGSASPCRVIVLTKPFTYGYKIERQINVTMPKVIVGNPLAMPMLNCSKKIERCFEILPGGRLDTRFLIMVRGGGRYVLPDRSARLSMGTHVRVQIGGDYTATGVLFRERNNTLQSFMKELENTASFQFRYLNFNLGQYVTVVGGNLFLQGCFFLRLRSYGVGYLTNFSLGREVLVIAGNAVFTGVHNIVHTLFASYPWMSGKVACVLGGTLTMIGGSSVYSSGPQLQIGYAIDLACLGGVLVTVGWSYAAAVVAMLRVGGGQIGVGAGTVYHTGLNYARAWVVGGAFGAGQTFVCGAGNFQFIGGSYASFINNAMFAGVGGNTWVGAGSLTWIGVPQARFYGTLNVYGLGGIYYNGAGTTTFIFLPQYSSYVAFYQVGIATDTFIGAGWLTSIQNTRVSYALVYGFNGLGTQMYIGAGGAIFIKTYSYYKRLKYWTTWPYTYTVGGFGIKPKFLKNDTVIVLTKDTYTNIQYNKETGVWKKKITARNFTLLGGRRGLDGEEENQRPVARTRRQNHYQRSLQEASQWLTDAVSTLGAVAVDKLKDSSIVLVDSTVYEATGSQPVSRTFFSDGIKSSQDPYAMAASLRDPDATDVTAGAVAAADDAQCFLCDVGPGETEEHADGDGICEVAQGCKGTDPLDSWEKATERTDQDLTFPQMDFLPGMRKDQTEQGLPDTYFLWYEMTVYCYSQDEATVDSTITSGCLSEPYVKDIITAFVDDDLDGGYDLAIAATALHAAALSFLPDDDMAAQGLNEAMRPAWNPECQGWTKYNIQFTTRENSMYVDLQKMFDAVVASPGDMGITMVDNYDRTLDVQPCEVSMIKKSNIKYPSFKKMPAFFPSKRGNLGPDVVVADVGSIVAADKIEAGKTYHIFAQNFPKGSNVQLSLMSADADPVQVASIPNFDDNDVNSVEWTAPLDLDEDTRFYIKGAPAAFPNLFGNSQLLRSNMFKRRRD